ncbi:hypothetical protein [Paludisphaera sp.]|uniref:hypothetical protein n=1 Tax=Paludisphaera sp. TaxID=2017432 RepID=UPI00301D3BF9
MASPGPGRQARCSFCNALVEIPYLPRVGGDWKRRRHGRPWWWAWAWWLVALSVAATVAAAAARAIIRGERAGRLAAIRRLVESSKAHEAGGRIDLALRDLDTALHAATGDDDLPDVDSVRGRRRELARRDVQSTIAGLEGDARGPGSLGDWLNLSARAATDRDLAPIRRDVSARFEATLRRWLDDRAERAGREADPSAAFAICVDAASLAAHLPSAERDAAVARFRDIAAGLVARRGVNINAAPGVYVRGTAAGYEKALRAAIAEALAARGYLPPDSRWADLWTNAPYRFSHAIEERHEGSYLGTQNRLARIVATLSLAGPGGEIWKTAPNARTLVPAPGMSPYVSSRLALTSGRVDEAERVLYEDAFGHIVEKIRGALATLPTCPAAG